MYQGVTPTFTFKAPEEVDLSTATKVWVTFSTEDERELVTKAGNDLTVTTNEVELYLTQQETLKLPVGVLKVQLNWIYNEGGKVKRACSNKLEIQIDSNLKREVLNNAV